jgi:hypothetical protein
MILGLKKILLEDWNSLSHVLLNILVWYYFLFRTFAKRFYISARIRTNLRDNFTNLSAL